MLAENGRRLDVNTQGFVDDAATDEDAKVVDEELVKFR